MSLNNNKYLSLQTTTCGPSRPTYFAGPFSLAVLSTSLQVAFFYIFKQAYLVWLFLFRSTTVTKFFTSSSSSCYLHFPLDQLRRHLTPSASSSFLPSVYFRLSCSTYSHFTLTFVLFVTFLFIAFRHNLFTVIYSLFTFCHCVAWFSQTPTGLRQLSLALEMSTRISSYLRTAA